MQVSRSYSMAERGLQVERTRERIVACARAAFSTGTYELVTLSDVAAAAGVTQQTLLNHFSNKEGLFMAVIDDLAEDVADLRGQPKVGDPRAAVASLMRQYEALGDLNVAYVALGERSEEVARALEQARRAHAAWLETVFGGWLPATGRSRSRLLASLYAITDVGTWKLLRRDLGHSRRETASILNDLLGAVLERSPMPGEDEG